MPAAIAIPMLIGAGTSVAGAAMGAHGAKKAADAQVQASDKALALEKQIYQDQVARTQPYVNFGTASLANLARLRDTPFAQQTTDLVNSARGDAPTIASQNSPYMFGGATSQPQQSAMPQPSMAPAGGPMVRLQAPTGEVRDVPAQMADRLMAAGARRLS